MKFNFRKITSVLASAVMLGSTAGFAAAAMNYPAPFVQGGNVNVAVVVGSSAATSDYLAAVDLGQSLQAELAKQTATSGTGTGATASGGDSTNLATSSRKLYYADALNAARSSLSSSNLPTILGDGKFNDVTGTVYPYTQTIIPGTTVSVFGTSGGDLKDPVLYFDVGTAPTAGLYNYTLSLSKNLNVTDTVGVQGRTIKILGVDYVIGASSTNTTLYLQGAGETILINGGESKTVTINGVEHTIELVTTGSTTQGKISVDGSSRDVVEGSKYSFPGEVVVYVKSVEHPSFAGDLRQVELIVGANALRLDNGASVKKGADETSIKGTQTAITAAGPGLISGFTVQIAMAKSQLDHIGAGNSFTNPVFGGLKVQFGGAVPALEDVTRGKVAVSTDNNQYGYVTFTSARAGAKGEQKIAYVYDNNTASTAIQPLLAHQTITSNNRGNIIVYEGNLAKIGDWIVVNQGDSGTFLEVIDITIDSATTGTVTFEDAITLENQKITLTNGSGTNSYYTKTGVNFYGGNGYTITANDTGSVVNITWSAAGTRTLFPRIKLKDGGWMALLTETNVTNGTTVIFPDGQTSLTSTGTLLPGNATAQYAVNGINWTTQLGAANVSNIIGIANPSCVFNVTRGPAVLFIEPKKWDDASQGNFICVPLSTTGTLEIAIGDPVFNGTNSAYQTWSSDSFKKQAVDKYGSFVTKEDRTNENGMATIAYPGSQMYLDVLFTAEGAVVTPGGGGGGTVKEIVGVTVRDSEVSSVSDKNLIVIGGSCVNKAAAKMLGSDTPLCGSAFTDKTKVGADQFIVKVMESPYSSSQIAMLVAGYEAADTAKAVTFVRTEKPMTDKDTEVRKVTQTLADVA